MIKGAQKQMIVIRTAASRYFTEAYFVLRGDVDTKNPHKETDMLREANRILADAIPEHEASKKRHRLPRFCLGLLLGLLLGALFCRLFF